MENPVVQRLGFCLLLSLLLCACPLYALPPSAPAQSIPVRYLQGTVHSFLVLKSDDGKILASGDSIQTVVGNQVTTHTLFSFKDDSIDDETTVFSQRGAFRLITDHHMQKGPSFPHPMDVLIDARSR